MDSMHVEYLLLTATCHLPLATSRVYVCVWVYVLSRVELGRSVLAPSFFPHLYINLHSSSSSH
jgi:hypothetical protein